MLLTVLDMGLMKKGTNIPLGELLISLAGFDEAGGT
jgi:hypothetical protein